MLSTSAIVAAAPAVAAPKELCVVPYLKVVPKKAGADSNVRVFLVVDCPKKTLIVTKVNVWKTNGTKEQLAATSYKVAADVPLIVTPTLRAPASMGSICVNTFQGDDKINGMCAPARA